MKNKMTAREMAGWYIPAIRAYNIYDRSDFLKSITGRKQMDNVQSSLRAQREYESYLKATNQRALNDWYKNVGRPQGRFIKYPGLSYSGQIHRADTSFARAGFDYDTASANYYGNLPYRVAGLYGIGSRVSRYI